MKFLYVLVSIALAFVVGCGAAPPGEALQKDTKQTSKAAKEVHPVSYLEGKTATVYKTAPAETIRIRVVPRTTGEWEYDTQWNVSKGEKPPPLPKRKGSP